MDTVFAACVSFRDPGAGQYFDSACQRHCGICDACQRCAAAAEMDRRRGNILCRDLCMEQCSCFTDHKLYDSDAKI